jgi:hypothetical protein
MGCGASKTEHQWGSVPIPAAPPATPPPPAPPAPAPPPARARSNATEEQEESEALGVETPLRQQQRPKEAESAAQIVDVVNAGRSSPASVLTPADPSPSPAPALLRAVEPGTVEVVALAELHRLKLSELKVHAQQLEADDADVKAALVGEGAAQGRQSLIALLLPLEPGVLAERAALSARAALRSELAALDLRALKERARRGLEGASAEAVAAALTLAAGQDDPAAALIELIMVRRPTARCPGHTATHCTTHHGSKRFAVHVRAHGCLLRAQLECMWCAGSPNPGRGVRNRALRYRAESSKQGAERIAR